MPKVTNIFTGFSTVCGDTMAEKKDPGKFTVRFNICDPQHKAVVDLLNQQGRSKAQFLTNAVLHYINCTEAPELHIPTVPDKKFLEEQILAILAEHSWHVEKNTWDCVEISDASIANGTAFIFVNKELQRVNRDALEKLNEKGIVFKFPAFFARTNTALVLKEPKTKTSTRKVFLPKTVAEMLKNRYQEIQEYKELFGDEFQDFNLVFCSANGRPMESQIITRALQKLIRENNLPPVVFHSLRHTSITYKLKLNGGDIKSVQGDSGHAQVKMVTDVYSHILDEDRRLNAQRFEEAFYQHKELSESSAEKLKSDTQNTHSDDDRKPLQDGGITDETMLNYLINNPEFLQKFKALLGV